MVRECYGRASAIKRPTNRPKMTINSKCECGADVESTIETAFDTPCPSCRREPAGGSYITGEITDWLLPSERNQFAVEVEATDDAHYFGK